MHEKKKSFVVQQIFDEGHEHWTVLEIVDDDS